MLGSGSHTCREKCSHMHHFTLNFLNDVMKINSTNTCINILILKSKVFSMYRHFLNVLHFRLGKHNTQQDVMVMGFGTVLV